jgi:hypothetical protein
LFIAAFVAALGVSGLPAATRASEMVFGLVTLEDGTCGARCPRVVVASGRIDSSSDKTFLAFARRLPDEENIRTVVLLDSPGGNVAASMRLGAIWRKLKLAVVVARPRIMARGRADAVLAGGCYSSCVYALMGGATRVVPAGSKVGVHRMHRLTYERDPAGGVMSARQLAGDRILSGMKGYARRMGIDPRLIALAESISPDDMRVLTAGEIRRFRLGRPRL